MDGENGVQEGIESGTEGMEGEDRVQEWTESGIRMHAAIHTMA